MLPASIRRQLTDAGEVTDAPNALAPSNNAPKTIVLASSTVKSSFLR
jgi:hypothetical protein